MEKSPTLQLQPRQSRRVRDGHPWVYSNELVMDAAAKALKPGEVVRVVDEHGRFVAVAHFNPHTLIAARVLARNDNNLAANFWEEKLSRALAMREQLFATPHYRLVHAEADGLPGLIIDRFGNDFVMQANTAGMDRAKNEIAEALVKLFKPASILLRGDTGARTLEGLAEEVTLLHGAAPKELIAHENGLDYVVDASEGQKTGWFYDQRRNRALVASLAKGKSVLDLYTHSGGFGLLAAKAGASKVVCVDRSDLALQLAAQTASRAGLKAAFEKADVFEYCAKDGQQYDVVVADPPAFAKSKKDVGAASKGYRKLAKLAAAHVKAGGFFFMASCSHAITRERFDEEVAAGLQEAGRQGAILARVGADMDHPTHPALPESNYLKGVIWHVA